MSASSATSCNLGFSSHICSSLFLMCMYNFCVCCGVTRSGKHAASTCVILSKGMRLWKAAPSRPVGSTGRPMWSSSSSFPPAPPVTESPLVSFLSAGVTSWISSSEEDCFFSSFFCNVKV